MLPLLGYTRWHIHQGQVPVMVNSNFGPVKWSPLYLVDSTLKGNCHGAIPGLNVITGLFKIYIGLTTTEFACETKYCDRRDVYVPKEHMWKYRLIKIGLGVAELTLVGGWILHGGATLYYYITRPQEVSV